MNILTLITICLLLKVECLGQFKPSDFGQVSFEELTTNRCSIDSTATAVILFDIAKVDLIVNYKFVRHARIKIFKREAIDTWANFQVVLLRNKQRISGIKGVTYNLQEGKIVESKLDSKNVLESKYNSYISKVNFVFPNVKEGSVIEFSYVVRSTSIADLSWQYQHSIPAYWSEYSYRGDFMKAHLQGSIPITEHVKETANTGLETNRWIIKNVPAFHEEPNSLPSADLIAKIDVATSFRSSWKEIGWSHQWLGRYGRIPRKDSVFMFSIGKKFDTLADAKAKVDSILWFVKKKVKWDGFLDKIPDREFKEAFESGKGSSSEVNMILMALLKKARLRAYPVFLSTRDHGILHMDRPSFGQFNDVITAVVLVNPKTMKEETILIDATDPYLSADYIPLRCLNGLGLVVNGQKSAMIPLISPKSRTIVNASLLLDVSNKEINGEVNISYYGLHASLEREKYFSLGDEKFEQEVLKTVPTKVSGLSVRFIHEGDQPLTTSFKIKDTELAQFSADHLYLNPYAISRIEDNIFKSETRSSVIDFSPSFDSFYHAKIELPPNYSVESLPKSISFSLTDGSAKFVYSLVQNDSILNFTSQLLFNRAVFQPDEYPIIREFYSQVLSKQAEKVVLKRSP